MRPDNDNERASPQGKAPSWNCFRPDGQQKGFEARCDQASTKKMEQNQEINVDKNSTVVNCGRGSQRWHGETWRQCRSVAHNTTTIHQFGTFYHRFGTKDGQRGWIFLFFTVKLEGIARAPTGAFLPRRSRTQSSSVFSMTTACFRRWAFYPTSRRTRVQLLQDREAAVSSIV